MQFTTELRRQELFAQSFEDAETPALSSLPDAARSLRYWHGLKKPPTPAALNCFSQACVGRRYMRLGASGYALVQHWFTPAWVAAQCTALVAHRRTIGELSIPAVQR